VAAYNPWADCGFCEAGTREGGERQADHDGREQRLAQHLRQAVGDREAGRVRPLEDPLRAGAGDGEDTDPGGEDRGDQDAGDAAPPDILLVTAVHAKIDAGGPSRGEEADDLPGHKKEPQQHVVALSLTRPSGSSVRRLGLLAAPRSRR
jgi:hypothetical protein